MTGAVTLITDVLYGAAGHGDNRGRGAVMFLALWYVLPLRRRFKEKGLDT